jgi:hypothetical protein
VRGYRMQKIRLRDSDNALVGIVVTFLLIGLIVAVISIVQTVYLPKWMEQTESEHMDVVADQFAQLKSSIDIQTAIATVQHTHTPISTSITLGSRELPFLMSTRAFGSLDILTDAYRVVITNRTGVISDNSSATIQYSSSNTYFLDQTYIYEGGAVVLSQYQGNITLIKPTFSVDLGDNVVINFSMVKVEKIGGKGSISGYGTYPIQTEFSRNTSSSIKNVTDITLYTKNQNAWYIFINGTLTNEGLKYNHNYTISCGGDKVVVQFPSISVILNYKIIKIDAQMAPGWIENTKGQ